MVITYRTQPVKVGVHLGVGERERCARHRRRVLDASIRCCVTRCLSIAPNGQREGQSEKAQAGRQTGRGIGRHDISGGRRRRRFSTFVRAPRDATVHLLPINSQLDVRDPLLRRFSNAFRSANSVLKFFSQRRASRGVGLLAKGLTGTMYDVAAADGPQSILLCAYSAKALREISREGRMASRWCIEMDNSAMRSLITTRA